MALRRHDVAAGSMEHVGDRNGVVVARRQSSPILLDRRDRHAIAVDGEEALRLACDVGVADDHGWHAVYGRVKGSRLPAVLAFDDAEPAAILPG